MKIAIIIEPSVIKANFPALNVTRERNLIIFKTPFSLSKTQKTGFSLLGMKGMISLHKKLSRKKKT